MYRTSSTPRLTIQSISSRIHRLRSATPSLPSKSITSQSFSTSSFHSPTLNLNTSTPNPNTLTNRSTVSPYRVGLKSQGNGMFGMDISNNIGKVGKNTGIKKYNQMQIKQTLSRNSRISNNDDRERQSKVKEVPYGFEEYVRHREIKEQPYQHQYQYQYQYQQKQKYEQQPKQQVYLKQSRQLYGKDLSPRFINAAVSELKTISAASQASSIKLYDYTQERELTKEPSFLGQTRKQLVPGKIYTATELSQILCA